MSAGMRVPWGTGRFERVLVYGLGMSGRAAARMLLGRGVSVVAVDAKAGLDVADLEIGRRAGKAKLELWQAPSPRSCRRRPGASTRSSSLPACP